MEAAFKADEAVIINKHRNAAQKDRLVSDPTVGVQDVMDPIHLYITWKATNDVYNLLVPPPEGPRQVSWKVRPSAGWMVKLSGLMFDLADKSPNAKVSSVRLSAAFKYLHQKNIITKSSGKDDIAFYDCCDVLARITLSMHRQCKTDNDSYSRVMRKMSSGDRKRVQLVLDKLKLPNSYELDPAEQSPEPVYTACGGEGSPQGSPFTSFMGEVA